MFTSFDTSASALAAGRGRMNVLANNLANAKTRDPDTGLPYRRRRVVFSLGTENNPNNGVSVSNIITDQSQFTEKYEPNHPNADPETGMLKVSNINPMKEWIDIMEATRAYEANVTAMDAAKSIVTTSFRIIA